MALQILENKGAFELHGSLNSSTSKSFFKHFIVLMNSVEDMTLNIDNLNSIDTSGVIALKGLLAHASKHFFKCSITGYGCKDIYDEYKTDLAA